MFLCCLFAFNSVMFINQLFELINCFNQQKCKLTNFSHMPVICATLCKCLVISLDTLRLLPGGSPEVCWFCNYCCSKIWLFNYFWQILAALKKSEDLDDDPFFSASSSPMATTVTPSLSDTPKSQNAPNLTISPATPTSASSLAPFSDHLGNISAAQTVSGQRPRLQQNKLSLASLRDQVRNVTGAHMSPERKDNRMDKEKSSSAVDDLLLVICTPERLKLSKNVITRCC
jgi:hypothetical protein